MPSQAVLKCAAMLAERKLKIAFVESATAGRMAAEFSLTPDSGKVLVGGLVCYDATLKELILNVPGSIIKKFTPESAEVTKELSARLQTFIPADIHVAITGLTTPGGSETPEKPVGTVFIHALVMGNSLAIRDVFQGTAEEVVMQSIDLVAKAVLDEVDAQSESQTESNYAGTQH